MNNSKKKTIGPSLPPANVRANDLVAQEDSTIDDIRPSSRKVYGPQRPPQVANNIGNVRSRSRSPPPSIRSNSYVKNSATRESWMTELQEAPSLTNADPLKIKSRTFIQKKSSNFNNDDGLKAACPQAKIEEKIIDEQIKNYNESFRQKTLQEIYEDEHMDRKKAESDADRASRIFDWERDMNSTVRQMSSKSAKDLLNQSKLNDRFGSSSAKKYL